MNRSILIPTLLSVGMVFVALTATACTVTTSGYPRARVYTPGVVIQQAPPPPRRVVRVRPAPPVSGSVWAEGHWEWQGRGHVWVRGYWVRPRANQVYVQPRWEHSRRGYVYHPGAWNRRPARGGTAVVRVR